MAPLVCALQADPQVESVVCVTGQHREMLEQVMRLFALRADFDLQVMVPDQTLNGLFARVIDRIDGVLAQVQPDFVLVHGDTSSASACALAAFHRGIRVGHIEAGLRTGDLARPFPEEMNRRVVDAVSDFMFAPTQTSRVNLLAENSVRENRRDRQYRDRCACHDDGTVEDGRGAGCRGRGSVFMD